MKGHPTQKKQGDPLTGGYDETEAIRKAEDLKSREEPCDHNGVENGQTGCRRWRVKVGFETCSEDESGEWQDTRIAK